MRLGGRRASEHTPRVAREPGRVGAASVQAVPLERTALVDSGGSVFAAPPSNKSASRHPTRRVVGRRSGGLSPRLQLDLQSQAHGECHALERLECDIRVRRFQQSNLLAAHTDSFGQLSLCEAQLLPSPS